MMLLLAITIGLNFYLYTVVQKGFFPQQDTGQLLGFFRVDQGTSFTSMVPKLEHFEKAIRTDPAVQTVTGFERGRGGSNLSFVLIQLKPFAARTATATQVVNRVRNRSQGVQGARLTLVTQQEQQMGRHESSSGADD